MALCLGLLTLWVPDTLLWQGSILPPGAVIPGTRFHRGPQHCRRTTMSYQLIVNSQNFIYVQITEALSRVNLHHVVPTPVTTRTNLYIFAWTASYPCLPSPKPSLVTSPSGSPQSGAACCTCLVTLTSCHFSCVDVDAKYPAHGVLSGGVPHHQEHTLSTAPLVPHQVFHTRLCLPLGSSMLGGPLVLSLHPPLGCRLHKQFLPLAPDSKAVHATPRLVVGLVPSALDLVPVWRQRGGLCWHVWPQLSSPYHFLQATSSISAHFVMAMAM